MKIKNEKKILRVKQKEEEQRRGKDVEEKKRQSSRSLPFNFFLFYSKV